MINNAINVVPKYCMMRLKLNNPDDISNFENRDGVHIEKISKDTKFTHLPSIGTFDYEGTKITLYRNLNKEMVLILKVL